MSGSMEKKLATYRVHCNVTVVGSVTRPREIMSSVMHMGQPVLCYYHVTS